MFARNIVRVYIINMLSEMICDRVTRIRSRFFDASRGIAISIVRVGKIVLFSRVKRPIAQRSASMVLDIEQRQINGPLSAVRNEK